MSPFQLDAMKRQANNDELDGQSSCKMQHSDAHVDINMLAENIALNCDEPRQLLNAATELLQHYGNNVAALAIRNALESVGVTLANLVDNNGQTALHWAALNGQTDVVQLLIDACPSAKEALHFITKKNNAGSGAVHIAFWNNNTEISTIIVETIINLEYMETLNTMISQIDEINI